MGTGQGDGTVGTAKRTANTQRMQVALNMINCPTRRPAMLFAWNPAWNPGTSGNYNVASPVARTDYACSGGQNYSTVGVHPSENGLGLGVNEFGPGSLVAVETPPGQMTSKARVTFNCVAQWATGVMYCGSMITMADITDGTSNTYLGGEKLCCPDMYYTGTDPSDDEFALMGDNTDIVRFGSCKNEYAAGVPPHAGHAGLSLYLGFRQRARQRLHDGLLRRVGDDDELHDRPERPRLPLQPPRRPADRRQEALALDKCRER